MDQVLKDAAQQGDINALYVSIKANPNILKTIDEIPFVDTPLHLAAAAGHIPFALEMMRLMPSFARKLNQDGFSPIHLALQKDNTKMVLRLVQVDPDLVRVKGREGWTPLHYFSAKDDLLDVHVLAQFLIVCPDSIQDLTIRNETALHIAVKEAKYEPFEVLLGWLQRGGLYTEVRDDLKKKILNWKDDEGNTVLHIATFSKQLKVVKSLIKNKVDVNGVNLEGLTALDILQLGRSLDTREMNDMLISARARRASSLPKVISIADYLRSNMQICESLLRSFLSSRIFYMSSETRSAILVVAVLIATATYQAGLNPPGGLAQIQTDIVSSSYWRSTEKFKLVDLQPLMWEPYYSVFQATNSLAFCASMGLILLLFPVNLVVVLLGFSLSFCYIVSVNYISSSYFTVVLIVLLLIPSIFAFLLSMGMFRISSKLRHCSQVIIPIFREKGQFQTRLCVMKFLLLLFSTIFMPLSIVIILF